MHVPTTTVVVNGRGLMSAMLIAFMPLSTAHALSTISPRATTPTRAAARHASSWRTLAAMNAAVQQTTQDAPSSTQVYREIFATERATAIECEEELALFEGKSATFGYIPHAECARLLAHAEQALREAAPRSRSSARELEALPLAGRKFVDLGSGDGRVVISAALLRPELGSAVGIELSTTRHAAAAAHVATLRKAVPSTRRAPAEVICDDMLGWNGLADADVVFVNNLCFGEAINEQLGQRLTAELPTDRTAVVLSTGTQMRFGRPHAERSALIGQSWGTSPLYVYTLPPAQ